MIDPVSGLFNRRYFHLRIEEEMQRASRHGTLVGLLMLDIDDFKGINDQFGHVVGDAVIRDVADILRQAVRRFDVCARYGGDEFVVIMADADEERVQGVAERIRRNIDGYRSLDSFGSVVTTTVSIGCTLASAGGPREVMERADQALYVAKNAGKNQIVATSLTRSLAEPDFLAELSQPRTLSV
jgi:diguanylate cyclase (GGDEF)-like protein